MMKSVRNFARDEDGAAMVEYALLIALVALVAIVGLGSMGTSLNTQFAKMSCKIANPSSACDQQ